MILNRLLPMRLQDKIFRRLKNFSYFYTFYQRQKPKAPTGVEKMHVWQYFRNCSYFVYYN